MTLVILNTCLNRLSAGSSFGRGGGGGGGGGLEDFGRVIVKFT